MTGKSKEEHWISPLFLTLVFPIISSSLIGELGQRVSRNINDFEDKFIQVSGSAEDRKKVGLQVANALAKTGFFLVENHGVSSNLIEKTMTHSKNFFSLKLAEKKRAEVRFEARPMMKCARGFTPERTEKLNPNMKPDVKESFDYGINSDDNTTKNHIGFNLWPKNVFDPKGFKETSMEYLHSVHKLAQEVTYLSLIFILNTDFFFHFSNRLIDIT